ncbi:GNAT family N-acetyltransferase [Halalkalibacterium halodurans]|uniref:GNAT family N-acetyltransferase n=1 Tax=Halalkalibacterium halodurans TaxID=86665 RepID=UPI002E1E2B9E|nr:GNAT family N-acetyltransferase [Halalkalibacterium halodurans]
MSLNMTLSGQNFRCFPLNWDTEYFGIASAKVLLLGAVSEIEQNTIIEFCREYKFITISNLSNSYENNFWIGNKTSAFQTDLNIQFSKQVTGPPEHTDNATEVVENTHISKSILQIAETSFAYSRFYNDPNLSLNKSRRIYSHWVASAFNSTNKLFVVSKRENNYAGFLLFSIDKVSNTATIELIAVDEKYRSQRIGKSLISKMEEYVFSSKISDIKVGTQVDNFNAIQFYISNGYRIVNCNSIYHLWN